jgi:hypothetical protein
MIGPNITEWLDPPRMDIGAPEPTIERDGENLWVAYRTQREGHFAVLRFSHPGAFSVGEPSDETLDSHPSYRAGLQCRGFHELHSASLRASGNRRWIITFHDETLDVTARNAAIVVRAVQAVNGAHAIAALRA